MFPSIQQTLSTCCVPPRLEATSTLFISRESYKEYSFLTHFFSFHYPKPERVGTLKIIKIGGRWEMEQLCLKSLIPSDIELLDLLNFMFDQ